MMEFYPQVKTVHVHLVMLSGLLFFIRGGAAALWDANWPRHVLLRYASYSIDSCLLAAAVMLLVALHRSGAVAAGFFANGWLVVKLLLLVLYVVLGIFAMRAKFKRIGRVTCYMAALLVFAFMYTVARLHHPLGVLLYL
ncbi:MAG: SirB2 family protein [Pseudomonadota bacterium]|nr:SirB2 family protein [Pseudomonadota bacterium]